jgi:hypothetical protein
MPSRNNAFIAILLPCKRLGGVFWSHQFDNEKAKRTGSRSWWGFAEALPPLRQFKSASETNEHINQSGRRIYPERRGLMKFNITTDVL